MRQLDLKVLFITALGCYGLLSLLLGTLVVTTTPSQSNTQPIMFTVAGFLIPLSIVGPPLLAGYVSARFASNRPLLHAFLMGITGSTLALLLNASLGVAAMAVPISMLGAYFLLRKRKHAT